MSKIQISLGDKWEVSKIYYIILLDDFDIGGIYETIEEAREEREKFFNPKTPILKAEIVDMEEE